MNAILAIAQLTWIEARRRRIVLAALLCGFAFILVFATAVYFMPSRSASGPGALMARIQLQTMTVAGLYAVNFMAIAFSVMLPVDTLSGEIASGVIQTIAAKPVRRVDILLGKWIVYWLMLAAYIVLMVAGVVGVGWALTGFLQRNLLPAVGLMQLEVSVLLTITIAGGVRFSTVTNGIVAFAFYAVAFIGGLVEQIGVALGNTPSRYIGTAISLLSPVDALWRLAVHTLLPPVVSQIQITGFGSASVPSMAMVWWSIAYVAAVLMLAARGFQKRAL